MTPLAHTAHRVTAVVAWVLAFTVAAGVSVPRPRVAGRDRARPGIARSGYCSQDTRRASMAQGTSVARELAAAGDKPPAAGPVTEAVVAALASPSGVRLGSDQGERGGHVWLARAASGRSPPRV